MKKRLKVMDFDGTLVFTPNPDTLVEGVPARQVYETWLAETHPGKKPFLGWWGRVETLLPPVFGRVDEGRWIVPPELLNEELAKLHAEHRADPENLVVLMTGRHRKMINPDTRNHVVRDILDLYGLTFDEYHFLSTGMPTLQFKCDTIEHLLYEHPTIREVEIFEDREPHYSKFWEFIKYLKKRGRLDGGKAHLITVPERLYHRTSAPEIEMATE